VKGTQQRHNAIMQCHISKKGDTLSLTKTV